VCPLRAHAEMSARVMRHLGREQIRSRLGRARLCLALLPWLSACAAPASRPAARQEELLQADPDAGYASEFYGRSGFTLGARAHGAWLGGDFDGETTLSGPDTIFLSDTDDGLGYELVAGYLDDGTAFELSYTRVEYEGEFGPFPGDVEYRAFGVRGLHYWRANSPVQPLAFLGLLFPLVDIDDGSSDGVAVGTGKLRSGFGLEAGGGVGCWLTRRLLLDLRGYFVYQEFTRAEGVNDDSEDIDDPVEAPEYGLTLGLTYVLWRKS
jgi:hypothetical protein